jgi:hypothetical protein
MFTATLAQRQTISMTIHSKLAIDFISKKHISLRCRGSMPGAHSGLGEVFLKSYLTSGLSTVPEHWISLDLILTYEVGFLNIPRSAHKPTGWIKNKYMNRHCKTVRQGNQALGLRQRFLECGVRAVDRSSFCCKGYTRSPLPRYAAVIAIKRQRESC